MGCWNGTCSVSNLAITAGTKVKVIVIKNNVDFPDATAFVYDGGYAAPMSFCIDASYNDYGSVEDIVDNKAMQLFRDWFITELGKGNIKIQADSHSNFDPANPKDTDIFEVLERGYVEYKSTYFSWNKETETGGNKEAWVNLGFSMIHGDIFETVQASMFKSSDYELKDFTLESLKTECTYAVEDFFLQETEDLTEDEIDTELDKLNELEETEEVKEQKLKLLRSLGKLWKTGSNGWDADCRKLGDWSNIVRVLSGSEGASMKMFRYYFRELKSIIEDEKEDTVQMIMDIISVIKMMNSLRVAWSSQTGAGSQSFDEDAYLGLAEGIKKVVYNNRVDIENGSIYCTEDFTQFSSNAKFKEDSEYKVVSVDWSKDSIWVKVSEDMTTVISYDEYQKYFEY